MDIKRYYDGTKLLSLCDLDGERPELIMCTSNRSAGKTVYFSRLCVNRWFDKKEKFCLIYRYKYELEDVSDKFYRDIANLFFRGSTMESKSQGGGIYQELYIDGENCGYAVALNCADKIKKYSHMFSDVQRMFFDEFQSETNDYCTNEIQKFISIHTSIARGGGKQSRFVPVYMCGNTVSILNPYYIEMGVCDRLQDNTRFLRGHGWILEQGFNENASIAQKESAFNRAFANNKYVAYSSQAIYLNDNKAFIEKPSGRSQYLATLRYNNTDYAIRSYLDAGIIYCDTSVDTSFGEKISVTTEDHNINFVMLKRNNLFLSSMRYYFDHGCFRFKDLRCKEAILKALSY